MVLSSCKDDSVPTTTNEEEEKEQVEGTFVGTWTSENADLPSQHLRDNFSHLVLTLNDDDTYSWAYHKKIGSPTIYTGTYALLETEDKHTSGAPFHWMNIYVSKINGQDFDGGWQGIVAFESPTLLKVNVEPTAVGWSTWPDSEVGLGSGQSGMESVFTFKK